MTEAIIYKLTNNPWKKVFPKLLEGVVGKGNKVHVLCSADKIKEIDDIHRTYEQLAFLPHGTSEDSHVINQPIVLSSQSQALNGAKILAITNGNIPTNYQEYDKMLFVFDASQYQSIPNVVSQLEKNGIKKNYFIQNAQGAWDKAENL